MVIDRSNQSTSSPLCNCLPGPCGLTRFNIPYETDDCNLFGRTISFDSNCAAMSYKFREWGTGPESAHGLIGGSTAALVALP